MAANSLAPASVTEGRGQDVDQLSSRIDSTNTKFGIVTQPIDWRAHIPIHPAADEFPLLSEKELRELAGDIKRNGLHSELVFFRPLVDGVVETQLVDGRNRLDALAMLGLLKVNEYGETYIKDEKNGEFTHIPRRQIYGDEDIKTLVYSLNLHRRHLTREQKNELIAKLLKEQPEKSDRQIATVAKASPTTVGIKRAKMESTVQSGQLPKRVGKDGKARKQPTKKKIAASPAKPKRNASQDQRELEAQQAYIDELEAAREHDQGLAEQLQAAKIKIIGLESEVEELKAENVKLREQLAAAQKVAS
jgi:hypothetical protein